MQPLYELGLSEQRASGGKQAEVLSDPDRWLVRSFAITNFTFELTASEQMNESPGGKSLNIYSVVTRLWD